MSVSQEVLNSLTHVHFDNKIEKNGSSLGSRSIFWKEMTMSDSKLIQTKAANRAVLHRVIFRLHFYAGILVAPFVLILAITGAIYLYVTEIEDIAHPDWRFIKEAGPHLPPHKIIEGALAAFPDTVATRVDLPTAPKRTAVVFLTPEIGEPFRVYVDPVSGIANGSFIYGQTLVGFADRMHGSLLMGETGDLIVELASCWTIVLILTGLYLWWPRTPNKVWGVFLPRLGKGRPFWRDLHALTGIWTSGLLLFLILSGLPWASNWGGYLQGIMTSMGVGYPASYRTHMNHDAIETDPVQTLAETTPGISWAMEPAPAPHSEHTHKMPISVKEVSAILEGVGLTTAYRLSLPKDAHDVFTAYTYPDQPEGQRTIHLDQYSGEVINNVGFADYGIGAKTVELGVAIHMGNYFGIPNQLLMLFAALGAAMLSLSGPIMWMKRRKTGLGAPKPLGSNQMIWSVAFLLLALGVIFPTLGITALILFVVERLLLSRIAPVRSWLGLAQ